MCDFAADGLSNGKSPTASTPWSGPHELMLASTRKPLIRSF